MIQYLYLILVLSFTLSGDSLFSVSIIWRVLEQGGSAKALGFFLCLITIVTFVLQEGSAQFKKLFQKNPNKSFGWVRIAGVVSSLGLVPLLWNENKTMLYLSGAMFTVLSFLTMITVEAIMGQEVLTGRLSSNKASRILQTAIQISAFLGASIAGFVLGLGGIKAVLVVNAATYASGLVFCLLLNNHVQTNRIQEKPSHPSPDKTKTLVTNHALLWVAFLGLAVLAVQIASFNFMVPIISQYEKFWTATQFGYIDAAAGLGAFLCTLVIVEKGYLSYLWCLSFLAIFLGDASFHFLNNSIYVIIFASFIIGFFANLFRIKLREFMYDSVSTTHEISMWTGRITAMNSLIKAIVPLMLAYLTLNPSFNFMICGMMVAIGFIVVEMAYFIAVRRTLTTPIAGNDGLFDSAAK